MAISLVLVAQFSLLAFSDFRPTANFGLLCAVGLLSGQFFELMLLPALLGLKGPGKARPRVLTR
jgi:predicted RND superfamily exporter protein